MYSMAKLANMACCSLSIRSCSLCIRSFMARSSLTSAVRTFISASPSSSISPPALVGEYNSSGSPDLGGGTEIGGGLSGLSGSFGSAAGGLKNPSGTAGTTSTPSPGASLCTSDLSCCLFFCLFSDFCTLVLVSGYLRNNSLSLLRHSSLCSRLSVLSLAAIHPLQFGVYPNLGSSKSDRKILKSRMSGSWVADSPSARG